MKYIILTLLLTSCSSANFRQPINKSSCSNDDFALRMEDCMVKFSKQGFDSKAVIDICESIYKRRN